MDRRRKAGLARGIQGPVGLVVGLTAKYGKMTPPVFGALGVIGVSGRPTLQWETANRENGSYQGQ